VVAAPEVVAAVVLAPVVALVLRAPVVALEVAGSPPAPLVVARSVGHAAADSAAAKPAPPSLLALVSTALAATGHAADHERHEHQSQSQ
jgi:hypothetical protein